LKICCVVASRETWFFPADCREKAAKILNFIGRPNGLPKNLKFLNLITQPSLPPLINKRKNSKDKINRRRPSRRAKNFRKILIASLRAIKIFHKFEPDGRAKRAKAPPEAELGGTLWPKFAPGAQTWATKSPKGRGGENFLSLRKKFSRASVLARRWLRGKKIFPEIIFQKFLMNAYFTINFISIFSRKFISELARKKFS